MRITIAGLMAIVFYVAVGFAALRNANAFWASTTFTVAVFAVSLALVGAFTRKGKARMPWAGFAAAGLACLVILLWTRDNAGGIHGLPGLLAGWAFHVLMPYINSAANAGGQPYIYYVQVSNSLQIVVFALVGAILGRLIAVKDER